MLTQALLRVHGRVHVDRKKENKTRQLPDDVDVDCSSWFQQQVWPQALPNLARVPALVRMAKARPLHQVQDRAQRKLFWGLALDATSFFA